MSNYICDRCKKPISIDKAYSVSFLLFCETCRDYYLNKTMCHTNSPIDKAISKEAQWQEKRFKRL